MNKTYAVSDIHGMKPLWDQIMKYLDPSDTLYCLGDCADRGNDGWEIIKDAINITNPIMQAIILFISSSGCARQETLNITIQDFIDATREYHDSDDIYEICRCWFPEQ